MLILPKLNLLDCSRTRILIIPQLPKLSQLYCELSSITQIPHLPNLTLLYCRNTNITSISKCNTNLIHFTYNDCPWLVQSMGMDIYLKNIKLLIILQRCVRLMSFKRKYNWTHTNNFIRWFYSPNGIGGRMHKQHLLANLTNKWRNMK